MFIEGILDIIVEQTDAQLEQEHGMAHTLLAVSEKKVHQTVGFLKVASCSSDLDSASGSLCASSRQGRGWQAPGQLILQEEERSRVREGSTMVYTRTGITERAVVGT